jgi:hypothetical protein
VFLDGRFEVSEGIFILPQLHVALPAEVPVLSNLLWLCVTVSRVKLDGHGEVWDCTSEVTLCLVHTPLVVICLSQIYMVLN